MAGLLDIRRDLLVALPIRQAPGVTGLASRDKVVRQSTSNAYSLLFLRQNSVT
jgi:hypothetical protein